MAQPERRGESLARSPLRKIAKTSRSPRRSFIDGDRSEFCVIHSEATDNRFFFYGGPA